jgi:hypothetical protein
VNSIQEARLRYTPTRLVRRRARQSRCMSRPSPSVTIFKSRGRVRPTKDSARVVLGLLYDLGLQPMARRPKPPRTPWWWLPLRIPQRRFCWCIPWPPMVPTTITAAQACMFSERMPSRAASSEVSCAWPICVTGCQRFVFRISMIEASIEEAGSGSGALRRRRETPRSLG